LRVSKPSRKRHPNGQPRFRRQYSAVEVNGVYGRRFDTVSHDAPLSPRGTTIYHWLLLAIVALGFLALIVLGR
jgi:hypothetical protein